jgi:hypothetical protein
VWTDAVQQQAGQAPTRGFGGRLMFYEGKGDKPVKVDGTLVVYAFDETGRDPNNAKPDRKFVFPPEQIPSHYSKSQIGHSYSVWVPWDKVGGLRKEITLIVRFLPKEGAPVVGELVRQVLPGEALPSNRAVAKAAGQTPGAVTAMEPIPAGYQQPAQTLSYEMAAPQAVASSGASPLVQRHITTTSIPIRSGLALGPAPSSAPALAMAQTMQPQGWQQAGTPAMAAGWYPPQTTGTIMVVPAPAPAAPSPGWDLPPRSRYTPVRSRPLGEPVARLNRDHAPTQPGPAGSPSAPAPPPGWWSGYGSTVSPPGAMPSAY